MSVIAVDIGGSSAKLAQVQRGSVLRQERIPHSSGSHNLDRLSAAVRTWLQNPCDEEEQVTALGIAVPGAVDPTGRSLTTVYEKLRNLVGVDLIAWAEASFGLPAVVENDGRAAGWGEYVAGSGRGSESLLVFSFGTGVGTSVVIGGRALTGRHGYGGILGGHQRIELEGRLCTCGKKGCLEAEASAWALPYVISDLRAAHPGGLSPQVRFEDVLEAAGEGDSLAQAVRSRMLTCWATGIANACSLIDPDRVVLTGGLMAGAEDFIDILRAEVGAQSWDPAVEPEVVLAADVWGSSTAGIADLAERLSDQPSPLQDARPPTHI